MNPAKSLIQPAIINAYLSPDELPVTPLEDWELGGIGLFDPSQGLEVQTWHMTVQGTGLTTSVWVSAPNTPDTKLFDLAGVTWARLAFDQNMHPVVSYMASGFAGFYWYDPTIPGNTFTALPTTAINPCVTMDDKRAVQTLLGNNDVVMTYVSGPNLYYRLQRDRYGVEYVWYSNITNILSNPFVNKIGMNDSLRLQLDIRGALYL